MTPGPARAPRRFDLLGTLPAGTTLLEASAGTGKTFTIAALATRYIAEGTATIDQLLMITFGRGATRELRERVRESLTRARDALRDPALAEASQDPVVRHLASLPEPQRGAALARLARATADFDAATIATTHQFCMHALAGLGLAADVDPGETFVEDISDLVGEVVDDLYLGKYASRADPGRLALGDARSIVRSAVGDPQAHLDAGPVAPGSVQETRLRLAQAARREVLSRRRRQRLVTFDDLVLRLEAALTDPTAGPDARQRLRDRYQVVLVDEFQDTDPAQWTILREAFHGHRTLILIGDPKQAIYAFRGADVVSYLTAAGQADHHATLPTNHRSDAAVVRGVAALMGGLQLGDPLIAVHPVDAAHTEPRLVGLPIGSRVRLRTWHPADGTAGPVATARQAVAADVAADIVATLGGPGRLVTSDAAARPVQPGDIAVLVATHDQGALVRNELAAAGVPVVIGSATSVFATPAAEQWLSLLRAMDQPRPRAIRAAALTDFCARTAAELGGDGERVDGEVGLQLRSWARTVEDASVAALLAAVSRETDLASRVLARPGGERHLTDLRHVGGALHAEQRRARLGLPGLVDWLADRIRRAGETGREAALDLSRRLETDAQAVQVLTIHTSKGLEFPIAYVPFGWDRFDWKPAIARCHDAAGRRVLDVRGEGAIGWAASVAAQRAEDSAESLRLLYVALTRASRQLVVHWASSSRNTRTAALHRVLCARGAGQAVPKDGYPVGAPPVGGLAGSPWVRIEPVAEQPSRSHWSPAQTEAPELSAEPFTRAVDLTWRRTSYTGLTSGRHAPEAAPAGFRDDEPDPAAGAADHVAGAAPGASPGITTAVVGDGPPDTPSPFADLPAGAAFGTLVHGVLESLDTSAADLPGALRERCRAALAAHPMREVGAEALAAALLPALHTPLGPVAAGRDLAGIPPADRLAELDFELPMGGDRPTVTLANVAGLLRRHLPEDDPLAGYADRLDSSGLGTATLRGYLTGSIDAVLRVPGPDGPAFVVTDYKTNLLADPAAPGIERLAWGYRPEVLPSAMVAAHYPLQALLYSAALHRYLRWRLTGYDPDRHLGGVLYLFLRGMAGPGTPHQRGLSCGVFAWRPPAGLVPELSDLLDGRRP